MLLREHKSKDQGLSDLLNYAYITPEGHIYNKDGAIMMGIKYTAPDLDSAGSSELDGLNDAVNRMALNLTDGWMIHVDDVRIPATTYPDMADFPCMAAKLIDDERREQYQDTNTHYENLQIMTFVWKFPVEVVKINKSFFIENLEDTEKYENLESLTKKFTNVVHTCINTLSNYITFEQLSAQDLLSFLNICITGKLKPMQVPPPDMFLDTYMATEPLTCGLAPKIGNKYIKVISIMGTKLEETYPGIIEALSTYPLVYRLSNRFIALSQETANTELKRYRKQWNNKITGFGGMVIEALFNKPSKNIDEHAGIMKDEVKNAIMHNNSNSLRFGYWSCEIVIMSEDENILITAAKDFQGYLDQSGFNTIVEDFNAVDAYLGTIPGHGSCNVRRVFLNSRQLGHVLPLNSLWTGEERVAKSSLLPKNAPACFYANTTGSTPFKFNVDIQDVGHQLIMGPPGMGKSTLLQFELTQFMRYKNAQIFIFDKDLSHQGWTYAMGGNYYHIGEDSSLGFAPFKYLETKTQLSSAKRFVEMLCELQGMKLNPEHRQHISEAVNTLATTDIDADRSLGTLITYAHISLKQALTFYSVNANGTFDMLDSKVDSIRSGHLHTFEMGWLIKQDKQYYLPVLMHQFNTITNFLEQADTKCPTVIVLEEAWQYLSHDTFSKYVIDWMKTLRKFNARLWIATQSLSDLYDPSTGALRPATAAIIDNCSTNIFLPNPGMDSKTEDLYSQIGLTERQIDIIKQAAPKRDYYLVRPQADDSENKFSGKRLFDLGWSDLDKKPLALSFIGLGKSKSNELTKLIIEFPDEDDWLPIWLQKEGQIEWLHHYQDNYAIKNDTHQGVGVIK